MNEMLNEVPEPPRSDIILDEGPACYYVYRIISSRLLARLARAAIDSMSRIQPNEMRIPVPGTLRGYRLGTFRFAVTARSHRRSPEPQMDTAESFRCLRRAY
jgi:hypothetical protein